jgi:hypothetical protein
MVKMTIYWALNVSSFLNGKIIRQVIIKYEQSRQFTFVFAMNITVFIAILLLGISLECLADKKDKDKSGSATNQEVTDWDSFKVDEIICILSL